MAAPCVNPVTATLWHLAVRAVVTPSVELSRKWQGNRIIPRALRAVSAVNRWLGVDPSSNRYAGRHSVGLVSWPMPHQGVPFVEKA
jgi:hypothetical protein